VSYVKQPTWIEYGPGPALANCGQRFAGQLAGRLSPRYKRRRGMGDNCGDNPCTWSDWLGPSPTCSTFLSCITSATAAQNFSGALTGGVPLPVIAYAGGAAASEAGSYASDVLGQAVAAGVQGATGAPPGTTPNTLMSSGLIAGGLLVGALVLWSMVKK
jgi:hypothetical protein